MSPTYRITTLGCRVNHAEARDMESVLRSRGMTRADRGRQADLEVVHTCSVTGVAAAKSRRAIRSAAGRQTGLIPGGSGETGLSERRSHRSAPSGLTDEIPDPYGNSQIIVTGCFASSDQGLGHRLPADHSAVIGHEAMDGSTLIDRFRDTVDRWLKNRVPEASGADIPAPPLGGSILPLPVTEPAAGAGAHVRAEMKIQDGCDAHCTFCIVPKLRRTLRSKTIADAVHEAKRLVDLGHREIVLTGIFIGAYGRETAIRRRQRKVAAAPLADLLEAVAQVPGLARLRLSSLEPGDLSQPLLDAMVANSSVVVPHLHLPLQSGSDEVLRRMNRQYRIGDYLEMIDRVNEGLTTRDGLPPAITTDIICGFPGETEDDFQRTSDIAGRIGYLHMHVFPYSARPGTAAARWKAEHLPPHVIRGRVQTLMDLEDDPADGLSIRFRRRLLGRTLRVILEQPAKDDEAVMTGRCDHYALVSLRTERPRGAVVTARIIDVTPARTRGEIVAGPVSLPVL